VTIHFPEMDAAQVHVRPRFIEVEATTVAAVVAAFNRSPTSR